MLNKNNSTKNHKSYMYVYGNTPKPRTIHIKKNQKKSSNTKFIGGAGKHFIGNEFNRLF